MNDQKQLWDELHKKGSVDHASDEPTSFAKEVQNIIPPRSTILELGCGVANDSYYFAKMGNKVLATDFSDVAIEHNKKHFHADNLGFEILDMNKPFPFKSETFDVVYARLSLHYFTDTITKEIFKEIHRILKKGGLFCFICKSTKDPLCGEGKKIEKDVYEFDSHRRHFFSIEYTKECLRDMFEMKELAESKGFFYDSASVIIKVFAVKK